MKVAVVTGSRHLKDKDLVWDDLDEFFPGMVLHGACPTGADAIASEWCPLYDCAELKFPADWKTHGKRAGPIRNRDMLVVASMLAEYGNEVVVFAYPRGQSPGTRGCVKLARGQKLEVRER